MAETRLERTESPRIAVAGVSGYAGAELVRLLLRHPRVDPDRVVLLGRPEETGTTRLDSLHPQLAGLTPEPKLLEPFDLGRLRAMQTDVLFLATPHEQSRAWAPLALEQGLRVVDLSGAWRLKKAEHAGLYGFQDADPEQAGAVLQQAVYGSPELHAERIRTARLVANPGCYATSVLLALAPLVRGGLLDLERGVVADAKSGVSGAGKAPTPKTHFMYAADNLSAYSVFGHRHTGELEEQLDLPEDALQFTPHLLPVPRGILSTIYVRLREPSTEERLARVFHDFFAGQPFVRLFAPGQLPQLQYSVRTNFCDIGFALGADGRRVVLVSCLDNLLKGAAGQAVQNMNLMLGWNEAEGLL